MKALIQTAARRLVYATVPPPQDGADTDLVRVVASGVGESDLRAFKGQDPRRPSPVTLGQEAAGIIASGPQTGRRVVINPLITCGKCEDCVAGRSHICAHRQIISMPPRSGAFAEFIAMPRANLIAMPRNISFLQAALTEPIARGWHAVRLCHVALDCPLDHQRCVVLGGSAVGIGAALALNAIGARDITVVESHTQRRASLKSVPQFRTVGADHPDLILMGGANIVIDCIGDTQSRALSCNLARPGGVIAHLGLQAAGPGLDVRRLTLQEIKFIGCYAYTIGDFKATAQAIFQGRL